MRNIHHYSGRLACGLLCLCLHQAVLAEHTLAADKQPELIPSMTTDTARTVSLELAVDMTLRDNPGLAEMRARAEAMAAIPAQAGSLPDPVVSISTMNLPVDTFSTAQEAMTQLQFGVSQQIPFPGKRELRAEVASFEAAAAEQNVEQMRWLLIRNVKQTWWGLFYLDHALQTIANSQELMRQLVEVAGAKYTVGQGLQQDVLLAQLELSRLLDRKIQLQAMRHTEVARLNAPLNQPIEQDILLPEDVPLELANLKSDIELFKLAARYSPVLNVKQQKLAASRKRRELAEKDRMPDFNVGAWYGLRNASNPRGEELPDMLSVRLSMNIPLYADTKQDRLVDQRTSELLGEQYALQDLRSSVYAQISAARADYLRAREQVSLFSTGIIPQARQTVASMLAAYQVNKVDFLNLVRAQITLYDYETRYWQALIDARRAHAQLLATVGQESVNED